MTQTSADDWPKRVAILGVGLLGGSVAHALRRARPGITIVGTGRTQAKRDLAIKCGAVDEAVDSIATACQGSDVVVVATPVDRIVAMVIEAAASTSADCLITDVGSTKASIVEAVGKDPMAAGKFVAAHPIAGSEKTGVQHADAALFDGKVIVLTPARETDETQIQRATRFWQLTGGQTTQMTPADHDTHLAAVSHVPHLVSALVARLPQEEARSLLGSGWLDITRVAAGDPTMWTAICQENRAAIQTELSRLADAIASLQRIIDNSDDQALHQWLDEAKQIRERIRERPE